MKRKSRRKDLTGSTYHLLTVLRFSHLGSWQRQHWECLCTCGQITVAEKSNLTKGHTKSCGCLQKIVAIKMAKKRILPKDQAIYNAVFSAYRLKSERQDRPFDLTAETFRELLDAPCYYCGLIGSNTRHYRGTVVRFNGIDREDNSRGYVLGNCVPCCAQCNRGKGTMSSKDYITLCLRVANKHT